MANDAAGPTHRTRSWWRGVDGRACAITAGAAVAAALAVLIIALPAVWYIAGTGADPGRQHAVLADLAELSALEARWERAAWRALNDFSPGPAVDDASPLGAIARRLEAAAPHAGSPTLQRMLPDVLRACTEKAQLVRRYEVSHEVSRKALRAALALEAEIAGLLRGAWRDAPDRQRLVAADNVMTQLFADVQRYYFTPAESSRKNLEASAADLRSAAQVLPDPLTAAAVRLDHHVAELLRARPGEHADFDRLRFHPAGPRVATLLHELRREFDQQQLGRDRYRIYLAAYFSALLVLAAYGGACLMRRALARRRIDGPAALAGGEEISPVEPAPPASPDDAPGT